MSVYRHTTTVVIAAGSAASLTLNIFGGTLGHILLRSTGNTTLFRAQLDDEDGLTILNWGYHEKEINDTGMDVPIVGPHTIRITNASAEDLFRVYLAVKEG